MISTQKKLIQNSVFALIILAHLLYILSFPLNFGGDGSGYYSSILNKHSALWIAPGYIFIVMWPFHFIHALITKIGDIPKDLVFTPWWQTSQGHLISDISPQLLDNNFSWMGFFQDHGFIVFQHFLIVMAIFFAYFIVRKYFNFSLAILFLILMGFSPLNFEDPSSTRPEWIQWVFLVLWIYTAEKTFTSTNKSLKYLLLGIFASLAFLTKFNCLPLFVALFIGLLWIEKLSWLKKIGYSLLSAVSGICVVLVFIFTFHLPTTGTTTLTYNSWILGEKAFSFLQDSHLKPSLGIQTKRLLAIHKGLPATDKDKVYNATWSFHIRAPHQAIRDTYREKLLWLMEADENTLNKHLDLYGYNAIREHNPCLYIAYFIGLKEYSILLKGLCKEAIQNYPSAFFLNVCASFFKGISNKEKSHLYRPTLEEIRKGSNPNAAPRFGFVRFSFSEDRFIAYHENVVWSPGVYLFDQLLKIWPPTWMLFSLAGLAVILALKTMQMGIKKTEPSIILFFSTIALLFILFSSLIFEFRLKEYTALQPIILFLAAIGSYQAYTKIKFHIGVKLYDH